MPARTIVARGSDPDGADAPIAVPVRVPDGDESCSGTSLGTGCRRSDSAASASRCTRRLRHARRGRGCAGVSPVHFRLTLPTDHRGNSLFENDAATGEVARTTRPAESRRRRKRASHRHRWDTPRQASSGIERGAAEGIRTRAYGCSLINKVFRIDTCASGVPATSAYSFNEYRWTPSRRAFTPDRLA